MTTKGVESGKVGESPRLVRTSTAAAMTMGVLPGRFLRDARLYCINLLLTYNDGCVARCAYCGLSRSRDIEEPWSEHSFIRVEWPTVTLDDVISRIEGGECPWVERVCVSMITNGRALDDTISVVKRLHAEIDEVSVLITPTIIDKEWLYELKEAGADWVGIALDAATPELFERLRGQGVKGPHRWDRYWKTVEEAVSVFGEDKVGIHLIVGLGETEREMAEAIQRANDLGAQTHLFSFFPEENSMMQKHPQPPIGNYRRIQLARYLINHGMTSAEAMKFDGAGGIENYGMPLRALDDVIDSGLPFMTSGCPGKTRENACNRPFANCTPHQAYNGEFRNYPFKPDEDDVETIRTQLVEPQHAADSKPPI